MMKMASASIPKGPDGNIVKNLTIPADLISSEVVSEDIKFKIGSTADGAKNMMGAKGQKINLPSGDFNKLYILAAATEDTQGTLKIGSKNVNVNFQEWTGFVGQHYGRVLYFNNLKVASLTDAFTKRDNIAWFVSHRHTPEANDTYQYSYLFKYEISLPKGAKSVILPNNNKIKIFAVTVANSQKDEITPLQLLYDDFKDNKPAKARVNEIVTPDLKPLTYVSHMLFSENIDARMMNRLKSYLKSEGLDTVIIKTTPSSADYADVNSGNNVSATYFATGVSSKGLQASNQKFDIQNIL